MSVCNAAEAFAEEIMQMIIESWCKMFIQKSLAWLAVFECFLWIEFIWQATHKDLGPTKIIL